MSCCVVEQLQVLPLGKFLILRLSGKIVMEGGGHYGWPCGELLLLPWACHAVGQCMRED